MLNRYFMIFTIKGRPLDRRNSPQRKCVVGESDAVEICRPQQRILTYALMNSLKVKYG